VMLYGLALCALPSLATSSRYESIETVGGMLSSSLRRMRRIGPTPFSRKKSTPGSSRSIVRTGECITHTHTCTCTHTHTGGRAHTHKGDSEGGCLWSSSLVRTGHHIEEKGSEETRDLCSPYEIEVRRVCVVVVMDGSLRGFIRHISVGQRIAACRA